VQEWRTAGEIWSWVSSSRTFHWIAGTREDDWYCSYFDILPFAVIHHCSARMSSTSRFHATSSSAWNKRFLPLFFLFFQQTVHRNLRLPLSFPLLWSLTLPPFYQVWLPTDYIVGNFKEGRKMADQVSIDNSWLHFLHLKWNKYIYHCKLERKREKVEKYIQKFSSKEWPTF